MFIGNAAHADQIYSYYRIFSFKHNNQNRVLVMRRDNSNYDVNVMIYDPENFSSPVASKTINMPRGHSGGVFKFGSNIVLGESSVIYEINPDTCSLVGKYSISDAISHELNLLVHDGLLFVGEYIGSLKLEIMDKVGHVTGTVSDFYPNMISSGSNLYFYDNESGGIFLLKHNAVKNKTLTANELLSNSSYATKVVNDKLIAGFASDGQGGFYYIPGEASNSNDYMNDDITGDSVYHYDGKNSTEVYSSSGASFKSIAYDTESNTLFLRPDDGASVALMANSNGKFEVIQALNLDVEDIAIVPRKISSTTQPTTPDNDNTSGPIPEATSMNVTNQNIVNTLLKTLGESSASVAKLPESTVSTNSRTLSDVKNELISPQDTKIYVFSANYQDLSKVLKAGDTIYVHMTKRESI